MRTQYILAALIGLSFTYPSYGTIGCTDTSLHGCCSTGICAKTTDRKMLHYVSCDCPCTQVLSYRGECRECGHYGNPERGVIAARTQSSHPVYYTDGRVPFKHLALKRGSRRRGLKK